MKKLLSLILLASDNNIAERATQLRLVKCAESLFRWNRHSTFVTNIPKIGTQYIYIF